MSEKATMTTLRFKALNPRLAWFADWLVVGVAVSLPWSTTATGILIGLWLIVLLPTLDLAAVRRELATAAGGLPVLLWLLGAVGMLWADTSWNERFHGLGGFNRLLVLPLLLAQFRRSERVMSAFHGFLASEFGLLLLSWALVLIPGLAWRGQTLGVPVKDYIFQSEAFLICSFALFERAFDASRLRHWRTAAGLVAGGFLFLADVFFIATGRTTLLVAPALLLLLGWRQFGWKGLCGAALIGCILGTVVWFGSPYLQRRIEVSTEEFQSYRARDAITSTALHLEFLSKSLAFIATAPIIGHGTGSIPEEFRNASIGQSSASAVQSVNPHNQIFAVAIQIGLVGAAVLVAMWAAHAMLFRGAGCVAWIGLIVVVENVVASSVNSHLFDFSQGWLYVFGVGIAGGTVLREQDAASPSSAKKATPT
jgi:O-antigen ligase